MYWYPQALLTALQAAAGAFFLKNDTPFSKKVCFGQEPWFFCNIYSFYLFLKTPNRRGTHSYAEKLPNFVLSSDIDLIGDRNDVRS